MQPATLIRRNWLGLTALGGLSGLGGSLLAACAPQGTPRAAGDHLFVATKHGLAAFDPSNGRRRYALPAAIPSPDWTRLYATAPTVDKTRLATVDAKTGEQIAAVDLDGRWAAKVASRDRGWVALARAAPGEHGSASAWEPVGRERTTFVLADPAGKRSPRRLELDGNYEPDAFSTDSSQLFALEYLPAEKPDRYRVRQVDLKTGKPGPLLTRFKLAPVAVEEEMKGQGRMQVLAPGASTLYTLYTKQDDHLHARDYVQAGGSGTPNPMVHAFVHTLNLSEGWAYCLDLPMPFGVGPASAHAIAVSRDGWRLFVADRSSGTIAVADTQTLQIKGTYPAEMDPIAEPGEAAIEVGPDGTLYVASGSAVLVFGGAALAGARTPRQRWPLPGAICGLKLGQDGQRLYAGLAGQVVILSATDGRQIGQIDVPEVESVQHVARSVA